MKLDCSYKVLAEDKPVLSNYPPKLHKKIEGVESWQHCCPRLKIHREYTDRKYSLMLSWQKLSGFLLINYRNIFVDSVILLIFLFLNVLALTKRCDSHSFSPIITFTAYQGQCR